MTRSWILRTLDTANRLLMLVGSVAIMVMMLHIVTNAVLRSVNDTPLTGTNEYVTYWYMPLVALLGFVVAQRERKHTEASVLFDRLPRRNRTELHLMGLLLTGVVCAAFAVFGWREAMHNLEIGLTGGVVGVVIWPMTFLVPVTYAVLTGQVLTELILMMLKPSRFVRRQSDTVDSEI